MERLQKVIYLIEENPLVSEFDDVEKILKSIFGSRKIKSILTQQVKKTFNLGHGGRNQSYCLTDQETRTYEIAVTPTDNYIIKVTGYNLQTCDRHFKVDEFEVLGMSIIQVLKHSMKTAGIV